MHVFDIYINGFRPFILILLFSTNGVLFWNSSILMCDCSYSLNCENILYVLPFSSMDIWVIMETVGLADTHSCICYGCSVQGVEILEHMI